MIKQIFLVSFLLLAGPNTFAQITAADFEIVIRAFQAEYDSELKSKNQSIVVNPTSNPQMVGFWWKLDEIRAAYSSMFDEETKTQQHYLFLLGGYARMKGMTRDGVAATLCHELGHGIAGMPYKVFEYEESNVSVEGQADYFAFRYCLPRIFNRLPVSQPVKALNEYTERQCQLVPKESYQFCTRAFQTLEAERTFFRLSPDDPNTEFDKHDLSVASKVVTDPYHYPSSQCRLDTMMNGILGKERPRCWYLP